MDRGPALQSLKKDLEDLKTKSIQIATQKAAAETELEELYAWFEEEGFDIDGDLSQQVTEAVENVEIAALKLLGEFNG